MIADLELGDGVTSRRRPGGSDYAGSHSGPSRLEVDGEKDGEARYLVALVRLQE